MVWNLSTGIETMILSKFQTTQCKINTQFEVCYWNDLTLTVDKHLLNNESEMCVGPFKSVHGGVTSVVHFISCHEQAQLHRVCFFISLAYSLLQRI